MNLSKKASFNILFVLIFIGISFLFDYHNIFNYPPSGSHTWRQTDCTSIIQNYYQNGMKFFEPRVHHVLGGEGKACPSEFPILYYITASIFQITQPHEGILKIINWLILLIGFFGLAKITLDLTQDIFYSLAVPILLVASPIIGFYSFNFLPNGPALGLCFLGCYFFHQFFKTEKVAWWIACIITFLFVGLLKIPTTVPFVAMYAILFLEKMNWVQFKSNGKIFKKGWLNLIPLVLVVFIIGSWVNWMIQYNQTNNAHIFLAKAKPLWSLKEPLITQTWHWILQKGAPTYHHRITRYFIFGVAFLLILFLRKKQTKLIYTFNVLIFAGALLSFILFFRQFFIHDYYAMDLFYFPATVLVTFFYVLKTHFPKINNHLVTKLLFTVFIAFNLYQTSQNIKDRYDPNYKFNKAYNYSFYKTKELRSFLQELNIKYPNTALTMEDVSPNTNLYYYNLKGWSGFALNERPFPPKLTGHFIHDLRAEYLILSDSTYLKHENIIPYLDHHLGTFDNSIFVYDLRPYRK